MVTVSAGNTDNGVQRIAGARGKSTLHEGGRVIKSNQNKNRLRSRDKHRNNRRFNFII